MKNNLTLLDGAFGTFIWSKTEGNLPVWIYNMTNPEAVLEVSKEYVAAGTQILQANTFSANRPAVERSSEYTVTDVVTKAVEIAKEAVAGTKVKVSLDMGPLAEMLEPFGELEEEECEDIYREMIDAGVKAGADVITFETFLDLNMLSLAVGVAKEYGLPIFCSMSFEPVGKTMFGNSIDDMIEELEPMGIAAIGMNCSLGPDKAVEIIKQFAEKTELPLFFKPNAGLPVMNPDGTTSSPYTAEMFADEVAEVLDRVSYVGGCCGSDPSYITALAKKAEA